MMDEDEEETSISVLLGELMQGVDAMCVEFSKARSRNGVERSWQLLQVQKEKEAKMQDEKCRLAIEAPI